MDQSNITRDSNSIEIIQPVKKTVPIPQKNKFTQLLEITKYKLSSFWMYIIIYLFFTFTHGIQGTYTAAIITTLERRFNLSSAASGFLTHISAIGYIISALALSSILAKVNKLKLLSASLFLTGLGALLSTIPHFIYGVENDWKEITNNSIGFNLINFKNSSRMIPIMREVSEINYITNISEDLCLSKNNDNFTNRNLTCSFDQQILADKNVNPNLFAYSLICLSEISLGMAGAFIWTVGMAHIDDNTSVKTTSTIIGLVYAVRYLSPIFSYGISSFFLSIYANLKNTELTPLHPQWVGAWWLGYFICAIFNFFFFIPSVFIPTNLRPITDNGFAASINQENNSKEDFTIKRNNVENVLNQNFEDLFKATKRIIRNPVFTLSSIGVCIDFYDLSFYFFMPKYLEVQYQQSAWMANLLGGMIPALFGALMSYIGGVWSGSLKPTPDHSVTRNLIISSLFALLNLIVFICMGFIFCAEVPKLVADGSSRSLNLTIDCNSKCYCLSNDYNPVCNVELNEFYFTPCHAGCSVSYNLNQTQLYRNCSCLMPDATLQSGFCENKCQISMILFVVGLISCYAAFNVYNVPLTNVVLKCVDEKDKSLALSIQLIAISITIIPAPFLFGLIIDNSCILARTKNCSDLTGSCLYYDLTMLRTNLHIAIVGTKIMATCFYYLSFIFARKNLKKQTEILTNVLEMEVIPKSLKT